MSNRIQITDRLAVDPNLSSGTVFLTTSASLPIFFSDGAGHDVFNDTIPGGTLGPNGYVELWCGGVYSCTATRTATFSANGIGVQTANLTAGVNFEFDARFMIQNINNEAVQKGILQLTFGGTTSVAPLGPYMSQLSSVIDTSQDWTLQSTIDLSNTANDAYVDFVRTNIRFLG